jgi:protein transport protein SEC24
MSGYPPNPLPPPPTRPPEQPQMPLNRPPQAPLFATQIAEGIVAPDVPPPPTTAAAQAQGAFRQVQDAQENLDIHAITLTRASMTGKVTNHESIPRLTPEERESEDSRIPACPWRHIRPVRKSFLRVSSQVLPSTPQTEEKIALPLGFSVQPLAEDGGEVPCIDFSTVNYTSVPGQATPVPRCRRCRAYINAFAQFVDGGRRWQCNLCRSFAEVPATYFCELDSTTGFRYDVLNRPELCFGSYDIVAPTEYLVRPPQRPVFLFVLDVSYNAVQSGMLAKQCEGILMALETMEGDDDTYVSFVAFDSVIYLFNLRSTFSAPKMIVAPDLVLDSPAVNEQNVLESVELPALVDDLVVSLHDSFTLVKMLVEKLPSMFSTTKNVESAFGPAINTALTIIGPTGGKIIASLSSLPSLGEGRLKARDDKKLIGTPNEYQLLNPVVDWYKQRAMVASQAQISIDLFVNDAVSVDLASVAPLSRFTSGHLYRYSPATRQGIVADTARLLTRDTGFEAVLRIRTSAALQVANCFGHCYVQDSSLLRLPVVDSDTSYTLQLKIAGNITNQYLFLQTALLYTTRSRERRIRVHTVQLSVSNSIPRVLNSMDCVAVADLLMKGAIDQSQSASFSLAQGKVNDKMICLLKLIKTLVTGSKQANVLLIPKSLRWLPQLIVGLFRLSAVRNCSLLETVPDERVAAIGSLMTSPPAVLAQLASPFVYCGFSSRGTHLDRLPSMDVCSVDSLRQDGIYFVSLGFCPLIWIGKSVDPRILEEFKVPHPHSSAAISGDSIFTVDHDVHAAAARFQELIFQYRSRLRVAPPVAVVAQGDATERQCTPLLIEDDAKEALGVAQYLAFLHRKVCLES